jgi:hypothetical protein
VERSKAHTRRGMIPVAIVILWTGVVIKSAGIEESSIIAARLRVKGKISCKGTDRFFPELMEIYNGGESAASISSIICVAPGLVQRIRAGVTSYEMVLDSFAARAILHQK